MNQQTSMPNATKGRAQFVESHGRKLDDGGIGRSTGQPTMNPLCGRRFNQTPS